MPSIDIQQIGEFISQLNDNSASEVLFRQKDWSIWLENPKTKTFLDYLIARRIEIQQDLTEMNIFNDETLATANGLKGGYSELGLITENFNEIIGRSDSTEDT